MLIAFNGKLKSGKDTAGERLAEMTEWDAIQVSFAKPLKESAAALLDIDPVEWETYKNDPEVRILLADGWRDGPEGYEEPNIIREFTAREFLQRYGTESHRDKFGSDFWVKQALDDYYPMPGVYFYVTDCRFINEAEAIKNVGGIVVRVIGEDSDGDAHISEIGLPDSYIDFEIDNSRRDDDFYALDHTLVNLAQVIGLPIYRETIIDLGQRAALTLA